ncbi:MAG: hypothetical protein GC186_08885 [Rhodobacteraceae bacterium]|nr:hypothetical protein [Paracoccaceae bacterium]
MHTKGISRRQTLQGLGAAGLVAATARRASAAVHKWDFTIVYGPGHALTQLYSAFADDVRTRTNGQLDITVRTAGELPFTATEAVSVCGQGQVEMALGYMGFIAGTTKIAALPGLPFLVRTPEDGKTAVDILVPYVDKAVGSAGCQVLFWNGQFWPQNLYGRGEPVTNLSQLKGRSVRGSSPEQGDVIRHYGGAPVSLTTAEVPEAMNRGVVNAIFTGAANIVGSKWTEFLEWGYISDPHVGIEYILINKDSYAGLALDLRKALDEAVAAARPKMWDALKKVNDEDLAELRQKLKIVDATPDDIKQYTTEFTPYWVDWAKNAGPDASEALVKIRTALGK